MSISYFQILVVKASYQYRLQELSKVTMYFEVSFWEKKFQIFTGFSLHRIGNLLVTNFSCMLYSEILDIYFF